MSDKAKSPQKRKRDDEEKSSSSVEPKTFKTKEDLTSEVIGSAGRRTTSREMVHDELIGMAVSVLQEHDVLEVDEASGRMYLTPEKLPPTPHAPTKPEVFLASPNTRFGGDQNHLRRTIAFDEQVADPEENAQDEDVQEAPELDRIDAHTLDISEPYNSEEPNYIARAAGALIDGLLCQGAHHKQWFMEQALKALIGNGSIEDLRKRLEEEEDQEWEDGVPQ